MFFWLRFIFSAFIIIVTGFKLSIYDDIIAEKSGTGQLWIGVAVIPVVNINSNLTLYFKMLHLFLKTLFK